MTSLRTTTYHTRVVRVFYTDTSTVMPPGGDNRQFPPNCCKIFHVPISHRVMDNTFVDGQIDIVLAKHGEVERRLGKWLHQTHGTGIFARQRLITSVPAFSIPGSSLRKTPLLTSASEIAHNECGRLPVL